MAKNEKANREGRKLNDKGLSHVNTHSTAQDLMDESSPILFKAVNKPTG